MKFRTFLMYVGQFDFQNQNFAGAYKAYDAWLTYPQNHKLVADEPKVLNDSVFDKNQVAYYACLAAYQGKDFDKVATHLEEALKYDKEAKTVRQLHLMTLLEKGDTAQWVDASKKYAAADEVIAQICWLIILKRKTMRLRWSSLTVFWRPIRIIDCQLFKRCSIVWSGEIRGSPSIL